MRDIIVNNLNNDNEEMKEDLENLTAFFSLLKTIDMRVNPQYYQQNNNQIDDRYSNTFDTEIQTERLK